MLKRLLWLPLLQVLLVVSVVSGFSLSEFVSEVLPPLSISISDTAQQFEGWGTSLAWFAEYVGSLSASQQDMVADLLFDPEVGLGLEIVRFNVGGSNTSADAVTSMRPFAAVPSVLLADGSYDWALGDKQAAVLKAAHDRGTIIFEAFSNSPPWFMTNSGDPSGNLDGADNLAPMYYDAYVDYLTEVVQYYHDEMNVTFRTVEPFNEPSSRVWQLGNRQEGCHYDLSTQRTILQKLAASLSEKGLSPETGISASDEAGFGQSLASFLQYDESLSVIDQINTHSYPEEVKALAQIPLEAVATAAGKRLWMSEYASGNYAVSDIRAGLDLSNQVLGDLKLGKVQAWAYWQVCELQ
ncbi:hypothetical protein ABBQ38_000523 [Trebouxia sp. C0009 RCD-2024]